MMKALVGAFSVIVQLHQLIVYSTNYNILTDKTPFTWSGARLGTKRDSSGTRGSTRDTGGAGAGGPDILPL